jgi:DNA-binding NtrC family response regulator
MSRAKPPEPANMHILFADDEVNLQELMRSELPRMGYAVTVCPDGLTAVAALEKESFDCLIVDLQMPGLGGIEVIEKAKSLYPDIEAIVMTGRPSQDTAIAAVKHQVFDYLTKPSRLADIAVLLGRVAERRNTKRQLAALQHRVRRAEGDNELIGQAPGMEAVRKLIAKVAPTDSSVMIRGETGCGKELVAKAVHNQSRRSDQAFVAINCGALPENLIESELFGHTKWAFTDAKADKKGVFEMADGGTLLLDEIGDMRLDLQSKFLRVLEDRKVRRLGGKIDLPVEVTVIATTNKELKPAVQDGEFRQDLFYRLCTFAIHLPPLRERTDDILPLARYFLTFFAQKYSKRQLKGFSPEAEEVLCFYHWPGNIRELKNVIERCVVLENTEIVTPENLPADLSGRAPTLETHEAGRLLLPENGISLEEVERDLIRQALDRTENNQTKAAKLLNISYDTLRYQVKKFGFK